MGNKIVLGLLPDSRSAETAVNNLSEADFDEKNISIIMQDEKTARAISEDAGPLKGQNASSISQKLQKLGITSTVYQDALKQGQVLIAIAANEKSVDAAKEMLADYNTGHITVV